MNSASQPPHPEVMDFLRGLMPGADDAKLQESYESLLRYVAIVARIYDRLERERGGDSRANCADGRIPPP